MSDAHCEACARGIQVRVAVTNDVADVWINYELTNNAETARALRAMADALDAAPEAHNGVVVLEMKEDGA